MPWLALAAGMLLTGALCWGGLALALQSQRDALRWQARSTATHVEAQLKAHQAAAQVLRAGLAQDDPPAPAPGGAAAEAWRATMPALQAVALLPVGTAEASAAPAARARDGGQPVASSDGPQLHVWLPLYARAALPPDPGQRRAAYRGVLRYTLAAPALLPPQKPSAAATAPRLRLLLQDDAPPVGQPRPPATVLADRAAGASDPREATGTPHAPASNELHASAGFSHAAHTWTVEVHAPARPAAHTLLLLGAAGIVGLGLSLGLAGALRAAQRRRGAAQAVAAGLSHELNQPIAALLLSSFNARAWLEQQRPDRAAEAITKMEQAAQRMGRIVAQWPVLAREGRVHLRSVNLAESLARVVQQAQLVQQQAVTLAAAPDRQVHVLAVAAELEQVLASLLAQHGSAAPVEIRTAASTEAVTIEILHPGPAPTAQPRTKTHEVSGHALDPRACRRRLCQMGGDLRTQADQRGLAYVLTLRPGA